MTLVWFSHSTKLHFMIFSHLVHEKKQNLVFCCYISTVVLFQVDVNVYDALYELQYEPRVISAISATDMVNFTPFTHRVESYPPAFTKVRLYLLNFPKDNILWFLSCVQILRFIILIATWHQSCRGISSISWITTQIIDNKLINHR